MITFEQAVREPSLRQRYVAGINFGEFGRYVTRARYIPTDHSEYSQDLYETCLMCTIRPFNLIMFGTNHFKSEIYVFKPSFDSGLIEQESDFISALVDHEGIHAEQCYEGRSVLSLLEIRQRILDCENRLDEIESINLERAILKAKMEVEAYKHQFHRIESGNRVVSPKFEDFIINRFAHHSMAFLLANHKQEQLKV
jgi:hypothetical protein